MNYEQENPNSAEGLLEAEVPVSPEEANKILTPPDAPPTFKLPHQSNFDKLYKEIDRLTQLAQAYADGDLFAKEVGEAKAKEMLTQVGQLRTQIENEKIIPPHVNPENGLSLDYASELHYMQSKIQILLSESEYYDLSDPEDKKDLEELLREINSKLGKNEQGEASFRSYTERFSDKYYKNVVTPENEESLQRLEEKREEILAKLPAELTIENYNDSNTKKALHEILDESKSLKEFIIKGSTQVDKAA